jgi:hypothetical protein
MILSVRKKVVERRKNLISLRGSWLKLAQRK